MSRIAVFGWGLVAPRASNIGAFEARLEEATSWLRPFNGFGPDNFMVGVPEFDFRTYQPWIEQRFPPNRFKQLRDKMDPTTQYAIGAFIQALGQNEGIETSLRELGSEAHIYVSTALGAIPTIHNTSIAYHRAQRRWNRFWSSPERNAGLAEVLAGDAPLPDDLIDPVNVVDPDDRELAEDTWFAYWVERSDALREYLAELREIEGVRVEGDVESAKLRVIREKRRRQAALRERWAAPEPPWNSISANLLWNIANTPASQVSMMGQITGACVAPAAACSTFGVALKSAMDAISRGEAKLAVIGAADPPPHPMTVGAFYNARVLAADGAVSKPLSGLKGTHVAGGACIWIVGDLEYGLAQGFEPIGLEPVSVGLSADADHIITPSTQGPATAMLGALERAGISASEIASWDLHATATPGDYQEVANLSAILPGNVLLTARKGTFGHGMGVGGGWELTAQYLGGQKGKLFPTPLASGELNDMIRRLGCDFVFDKELSLRDAPVGKLSMGVGGINACVISRPYSL